PRRASAGGSSRRAMKFNALSGSPVASARAAAVISESIQIPTHLPLLPCRSATLCILTTDTNASTSQSTAEGRRKAMITNTSPENDRKAGRHHEIDGHRLELSRYDGAWPSG